MQDTIFIKEFSKRINILLKSQNKTVDELSQFLKKDKKYIDDLLNYNLNYIDAYTYLKCCDFFKVNYTVFAPINEDMNLDNNLIYILDKISNKYNKKNNTILNILKENIPRFKEKDKIELLQILLDLYDI